LPGKLQLLLQRLNAELHMASLELTLRPHKGSIRLVLA
jgi:hypothetical protein